MKIATIGILALAAAAGSASAATFSFASDNDHSSWTFQGAGSLISAAMDPGNPQTLLIDDDNGALPALSFNVEFRANMQLQHASSVAVGGGNFLHIYNVVAVPEGPAGFGFFDGQGNPLLVATFSSAVFRAAGPGSAWGTAANLSASDLTGNVTYTWFGPDLPQYGLFQGQSSIGMDDAAFTFTALQSDAGPGVPLGTNMFPSMGWVSEGSYSGSAQFVPAPGVAGLLGLAGLAAGRRRR
jgi:MYXO-CTERM domain-containing protein